MSARKEKKADLTLDPPAFTLEDENPDLEIFTFRMPSRIPLNSLDKLEFDLSGTKPCTFQAGDAKYKLQLGTAVENESFRVLVPKAKAKKADDKDSDDSDDDDDDDEKYLQPASIIFSRHFNVLATTKELNERTIAPHQDKAPANVDPMFRAYSHVPQKTGLKRRWMPLGVPVAAACAAEPKRVKTTTKTTTPIKKESSPSKKQKEDKGKKLTTPIKETNGKSSPAKPKRIKLEDEDTTNGDGDGASKSAKKDKDKKEAKKDKKESKKKRKSSSIKKKEEEE